MYPGGSGHTGWLGFIGFSKLKIKSDETATFSYFDDCVCIF